MWVNPVVAMVYIPPVCVSIFSTFDHAASMVLDLCSLTSLEIQPSAGLHFLLWTSRAVDTRTTRSSFLQSRTTSTGGKLLRYSLPTFFTHLYIV